MRALSPVELALIVSLTGCVAAVSVPAFFRNLQVSRLVEPMNGVQHLAGRAAARAAALPIEQAFPETAPLTPAEVPRGERLSDPPNSWEHPTWKLLEFSFSVPHAYSFGFESSNAANLSEFRAHAAGDLDGDGVHSQFQIRGEMRPGQALQLFPLEVEREVE